MNFLNVAAQNHKETVLCYWHGEVKIISAKIAVYGLPSQNIKITIQDNFRCTSGFARWYHR